MRSRLIAASLALVCVLPSLSCTVLLGYLRHDMRVVLIDAESKKPVASVRMILARKAAGKRECTIDTALTGVSNALGEVRIASLPAGEYVVFYNVSGSLNPKLKGKVVGYDRVGNAPYMDAISESLGSLGILKGSQIAITDGMIGVGKGHMYATDFDVAMIAEDGTLLSVRVPAGGGPVKIEINTDYPAAQTQ